jgi:hypothetical protein
MAREFDRSTSNYLEASGAPVSGTPLSITAWFNVDIQDAPEQEIVALHNSAGGNALYGLGLSTGTSVQGETNGAAVNLTNGVGIVSLDTWHHAAGVWRSNTSRTFWLDTISVDDDTNTGAEGTVDVVNIGVIQTPSLAQPFDGEIADVAIWNAALEDDEILALASGATPLMIRPGSLVAYWPLYTSGTDPDWVGDNPMVETGTVAKTSARGPVRYPHAQIHMYPPLTAPTPVYEQVSFRFREDNGGLEDPG